MLVAVVLSVMEPPHRRMLDSRLRGSDTVVVHDTISGLPFSRKRRRKRRPVSVALDRLRGDGGGAHYEGY
ncbi:MAG: hypothetical protein EOP19_02680 [Hyphomicrobiales bacterium]|nr:MAG: hypothetical protein EOP19_02680 [Hyphomicrobiales bacterium]